MFIMSNQELLVFVQTIDYKLQEEGLDESIIRYLKQAKKELVNEIICDKNFDEFCESKGLSKTPFITSYWDKMKKIENNEDIKPRQYVKTYDEIQDSWIEHFNMSE